MDGLKQGDTDRVEYSSASIPLPIISKNWRLNLRFLEESRRKGMPMDSYFTAETARVVAEYAENMTVNGAKSLKFGGDILYGLLDSPNVEGAHVGGHPCTRRIGRLRLPRVPRFWLTFWAWCRS